MPKFPPHLPDEMDVRGSVVGAVMDVVKFCALFVQFPSTLFEQAFTEK
jgi:hypothetical protein